jgi:hypothetical protein
LVGSSGAQHGQERRCGRLTVANELSTKTDGVSLEHDDVTLFRLDVTRGQRRYQLLGCTEAAVLVDEHPRVHWIAHLLDDGELCHIEP